ncbi:MAG: hypothetical protein ACXWMW_08025 [Syntrophales bacterium]
MAYLNLKADKDYPGFYLDGKRADSDISIWHEVLDDTLDLFCKIVSLSFY